MKQINKEKIINKLLDYEYVSFDIFDTLIKRNIENPSQVFSIVKKKYEQINKIELSNFISDRVNAEGKAKLALNNKIPNINDIYDFLGDYTEEQKTELKEIEINTELEVCQCNYFIKPIYDDCLNHEKKIIIISDMYFTRDIIEKILKNANITHYEKLYISCEMNATKRTGKLFDLVLQDLNITGKKMIHIGDSKIADFLMPRKYSIDSILISKKLENLTFFRKTKKNDINDDILCNYINNNINLEKNSYYQFGYETLGPVLYGFTNWLIGQAKEHQIKDIFFLAREGNLLKKSFDLLNKDNEIKSHYLYCSRRSTRVPLLKDIKKLDDVFEIARMRRLVDVESFFINVGLDINRYYDLLERYHINAYDNIKNINNFTKFFNEIKEDIIHNAEIEEKKLIEYLKQEEFYGNVAVCDVGWVGTMQNSLSKHLTNNNINNEIYGFYLGLNPDYQNTTLSDFMFDYMFCNSHYQYIHIASFLNLFESLFLAQHGTTIKYQKLKNKIVPVLDDYEYSSNETESFINIQDGAIDFVENFQYKISADALLKPMFLFGMYPKLKDIRLFANMKYIETKKFNFISTKPLFYYCFHPKKLYIDFCNCSWKIGFLKSIFKVNLDYFTVYKILSSFMKNNKR